MTWIETIEPADATGPLAALYEAIGSSRGGVARVHRAQSLHPRALKAHLELYKAVVFARSSLSRVHRERLAVVVSAANRCSYCVQHHGEAARQAGDDADVIAALGEGLVPDTLPQAEQALLRWGRTAALAPADLSEAHIVELRAHGWDERAMLDASLTVSYFSFVNRLVLTLGVHLEENFAEYCGDDPVENQA